MPVGGHLILQRRPGSRRGESFLAAWELTRARPVGRARRGGRGSNPAGSYLGRLGQARLTRLRGRSARSGSGTRLCWSQHWWRRTGRFDLPLRHHGDRFRVRRIDLVRLHQIRPTRLCLSQFQLQIRRGAQRGLVVRRHLESPQRLLQRLPIFPLLLVNAREQQPGFGFIRMGFDALFADDHRLHETTHPEIRFGERLVGVRGRIRRERMLQLRELGRAQRFRWGACHRCGGTLFYCIRSEASQMHHKCDISYP